MSYIRFSQSSDNKSFLPGGVSKANHVPANQRLALKKRLDDVKANYPGKRCRFTYFEKRTASKKTILLDGLILEPPSWVRFVRQFTLDNKRSPHKVSAFGVDLSRQNLTNFQFIVARLPKINLRHSNLYNSNFSEVNFNDAKFEHANLKGTLFVKSKLNRANLNNVVLGSGGGSNITRIDRCDLRNASLNGVNLTDENIDLFMSNFYRGN